MSIIINNISIHGNPVGKNQYELLINRKLIAKFEHRRDQGLAECLREAADAVDRAEGKLPALGTFAAYLHRYKKIVDKRLGN